LWLLPVPAVSGKISRNDGCLPRPSPIDNIESHQAFFKPDFAPFLLPQAGIVQPAHQPGGFEDGHEIVSTLENLAGASFKKAASDVDDSHIPIQPQPIRLKVSPFKR